ncbi:MAG TPA: phosphoribosylamine--glycine ligase, partial [Candidatus Paceibacterota bacterium]|nr:phosphoribosylamine--glycine ligase [Candidatus Paceibacterota bacterium]
MPKVDVLVVGNGSREHALAWKAAQSPRVGTVYVAPGNGGTARPSDERGSTERNSANVNNVAIGILDIQKLADFAQEKKIGLTIAGMDDPIAAGIVDVFEARGLRIFGPSKAAAQIEWSKAFAKQLMH